ncbi:MAG: RluA family pseudouridine synthase [Acidobacteriaceae bacterium]
MPGERSLIVPADASGQRLDQYLALTLEVSRARVQWLMEEGKVLLAGHAPKPSLKLRGGESLLISGEAEPRPLHAEPEAIPLTIVYEDDALAVVDKPAGMMVHAGSGSTDDARNRGTMVNALLHHFTHLSGSGGGLRPGIVHRLDKQTSGLLLVAKNDTAHAKLAAMFSERRVQKTYLALVHGALKAESGTINTPIGRDAVRRIRMTTRREGGRSAISHYKVLRRIEGQWGRFTLVSVRIETGRTHQIRVHLASLGHPVVGDTLYGAPAEIQLAATALQSNRRRARQQPTPTLALPRNFLHAAELGFAHPLTAKALRFTSELPAELAGFLACLSERPGTGPDPASKS